jgi:dihydrofolate reductase
VFDIVLAADLDWSIGKANALPWPKLTGDLQHFKRITCATREGMRTSIIMGRRTWESVEVGSKPLPRRLNIVVTSQADYAVVEGVLVAPSLATSLELAAAPADIEATFVVGGAALFRDAFPHPQLRYIYLTRVESHCGGDTHVPDLDRDFVHDAWAGEQALEDNGVRYRIERLVRR